MSKDSPASPTAKVSAPEGAVVTDLRKAEPAAQPIASPGTTLPGAAQPLGPVAAAERSGAAQAIREVRRRRARSLLKGLCLFVLVPTLAGAAYFGLLASDRYESVALFTVDSSDVRSASAMESLIGMAGGSTSIRDTMAVRDFVLSRAMLADLDKTEKFISHYENPSHDWWSRLRPGASFERAYKYYQDMVLVGIDPHSGVLTLRVRAFTAERAQAFARHILLQSEKMVNELAERARQDQIAFATREVDKAEDRLSQARQDFVHLQQEHGDFSPEQTAAAAISIRTALEGELARARAELAAKRSYMASDHPDVIGATERVRSLAGQAAGETRRLVDPKGENSLNTKLVAFERASVEKEFATRAYQTALASLEVARTNAIRKHRYLATIAQPSVADEAQYPRRWLGTLTVFLASLLFFGIASLLAASIKEHARL